MAKTGDFLKMPAPVPPKVYDWRTRLPEVAGVLQWDAPLAAFTWFRVGGPVGILFLPKDATDLQQFLAALDPGVPVTILGAASNVIVRDGGIDGVVIRLLGGGFGAVSLEPGGQLRAGAGALDAHVAKAAAKAGLGGLEFYSGIPGAIGGAVRMNAGCYGLETKDVLIEAEAIDRAGRRHVLTPADLGFAYRHSALPEDFIVIAAKFQGNPDKPEAIAERMAVIAAQREASQPIREKTGGSTFKNPDPTLSGGRKAWQLIDAAGLRGARVGDAQMSNQHCNFMINVGTARAADLEELGEQVRAAVHAKTGVMLDWEIKRLGLVS